MNARRMYASCVDEDGIEAEGIDTILSFVNTELGGWPILQGSTWNNATFNFSRILLKLNEYWSSVLYNIGTQIDSKNSSFQGIRFDFLGYLREFYLLANITLLDTDIVTVSELEYLRNVSLIINQQSSLTLQNYMVWRFMMSQASNMPKHFRTIRQQFDKVFQGINTEPSRAIVCGEYVNNIMGFAVAKLYINEYFDQNARNQSLELIDNIRNVFIDMVNQSTWMDSVSKSKAIEKARAIREKIAYPDYLNDDNITKLEEIYAEHNFNSSFMRNFLLMLHITTKRNLRSLRQPIDRTTWEFPPVIVNAFYNPSLNDICFPAGILQLPFFHKDVPKYLNYGGIGMVMGHEITHGFDDEGRQFDKDGNRLNGEQTQGENIADNGGLKEAFFVRCSIR
ncbi:unnamed protein product [Rotaria sp. Silwood1]|nr:unnamed protein product [Rotaria sp. Silwood1]CAF4953683.1 unnamed protein product [Rotaria sp. Silwood1]